MGESPVRYLGALCMAVVMLVANEEHASEPAQISDDERREAGCIDTYNDPKFVDPDHFHHNPVLIRLRGEGLGAAAPTTAEASARRFGYGGRLDIDSPVWGLFASSGAKDIGLAAGV